VRSAIRGSSSRSRPAATPSRHLPSPIIRVEANLLRFPLFALNTKNLKTMDGIECSVLENSSQCTVSIKYTKDRAGCLAVREWTVEEALAFADETVRNSGHGCTSACGSWKRLTAT
jgi:hypothetical protein